MSSGDYWYQRAEIAEEALQEIAEAMSGFCGPKHDLLIEISEILERAEIAVVGGEYDNGLADEEDEENDE